MGGLIERFDLAAAWLFNPGCLPSLAVKTGALDLRADEFLHTRCVEVANQTRPHPARVIIDPDGEDMFGVGLVGVFPSRGAAMGAGEV